MKRRLSAIVLALGLSLSVFSMGVYAEETETEAVTEQVTEAVTEAVAEGETEATAETEAMTQEEYITSYLSSNLSMLSSMTDEELEQMAASDDMTSAAIAMNWNTVKEELGAFVEVTSATLNEDGTEISGVAVYEKTGADTEVFVTYTINADTQTATMNWTVNYSMGTLLQQAGLNTVMGLGIVFITLAFLAFLISKLHIIPDTIEKMARKNAPAVPVPKADPAPVAAPVVEEEEYVDDLELVAVITAAIAASENTSSDGFVVRSIKKANKRNWQRA